MTQKASKRTLTIAAMALAVVLLLIDQLIKIEVKTTMTLGQSHHVTNWFYITFVENNGMAWGMTFINKMVLSLMRIAAVVVITWFIGQVIRQGGRTRFVILLTLIAAGAAGNIIDSMFYGLCFTASSPYYPAYTVPIGHGYAPFLMGKVVDMFYFPLIVTQWPDWVPFVGGNPFIFFSPVFNFADACISVGVILLILFCRKDIESIRTVASNGLKRSNKDKPTPNNKS